MTDYDRNLYMKLLEKEDYSFSDVLTMSAIRVNAKSEYIELPGLSIGKLMVIAMKYGKIAKLLANTPEDYQTAIENINPEFMDNNSTSGYYF